MTLRLSIFLCVVSLWPIAARAQAPAPPPETPQAQNPAPGVNLFKKAASWQWEQVSRDHIRYVGQAEIESDTTKFFADQVDIYTDTNLLEATGNVVFAGPEGRISAERVEYNLQDGTGVFHQASGVMSLGTQVDRAAFGGQDPDVLFYGEQIERLGGRRYRVTRGGFTTCVQPTPRWEVASGSVTLNLNDYAIAKNIVLRVKGVPMFYLPVLYYPIQDDDRATGLLLPTYGASTIRGQAISNAFFWAIDRSQDATFFHDWFTRSGQGVGGEYRYVSGPQSNGNFRLYHFDQKETAYTTNGVTTTVPASRSFELTGTAMQTLGARTRARVRLEYFSDILTQQLYQQDIYQSTRRNRIIEGGLTSSAGPVAMSALYQRNESFNDARSSVLYGNTPRLTASLAPLHLGGPFYLSANSEYAYLPYEGLRDGETVIDRSLGRTDFYPTLRMPMSTLPFLTVNSSASYRTTYYSRSYNAAGRIVEEPYHRQYASLRSEIVGPVFTRIWDLAEDSFAERLKHVIEPVFTADYTSPIDDVENTPILSDSSEFVVGGAGRFTYGLNNRFFYRGRTVDNVRGQTREFITVTLQQTFYTNPESSLYDTQYASSSTSRMPVDLSPLALNVRVSPSNAFNLTTRAEYDVSGSGLQVFTTGSDLTVGVTRYGLNYSRQHPRDNSDPSSYLSANSGVRLGDGRIRGTYDLSWSISQGYIVSQRIMASYMAQCCGLQFDFQRYNYPSSYVIPADRRFNFSFVLAGLGTFSNFFGAFGGQ